MGLYINIGNDSFRAARNGEYVDKSALIKLVNNSLNSELLQWTINGEAKRMTEAVTAINHIGENTAFTQCFESWTIVIERDTVPYEYRQPDSFQTEYK